MAKIKILPEQLANQIAAGEVVERPASVIKELVENSLDAGATRIEVEVEGGGTRLMRVIDNGEGMEEDDLYLCLERHGTSKIRDEETLGAIGTLGFRGEAIPSIGSVAKLTLQSRTANSPLGYQLILHYGKLVKAHELGCSVGTTVEVRNLFGNTPARRKFLRTQRTEQNHIDEIIRNYALCSKGVSFRLRVDDREALAFDDSMNVEERLRKVLNYRQHFIEVDGCLPGLASHRVTGLLLAPEHLPMGPGRLRLFVNGRTVKDRLLMHAVNEGLRGFLMKGRSPAGMIQLFLPPEMVDVNVHPAKHEVRFRNSREIHTLVVESIARAMQSFQKSFSTKIFGSSQQPEHRPIPEQGWGAAEQLREAETTYSSQPSPPTPAPPLMPRPERLEPEPSREPVRPVAPAPQSLLTGAPRMMRPEPPVATPVDKASSKSLDTREKHHNLTIIGQFDDLYIFCRSADGLVVIDQHAAHERLLYERLKKQYLGEHVARQTLMFPVTVELTLFQAKLVEKYQDELAKLGFSVSEFGGTTYLLSAVPALASRIPANELFLDVLELFGSETAKAAGGILDTIIATMACRAAVKAGTELGTREIEALLSDMARADLFSHCPHGRPVIREFGREEIKKWFHRG